MDVEDLAAVGVVLGTSVWPSETLPEVGCRAKKAVSQADQPRDWERFGGLRSANGGQSIDGEI